MPLMMVALFCVTSYSAGCGTDPDNSVSVDGGALDAADADSKTTGGSAGHGGKKTDAGPTAGHAGISGSGGTHTAGAGGTYVAGAGGVSAGGAGGTYVAGAGGTNVGGAGGTYVAGAGGTNVGGAGGTYVAGAGGTNVGGAGGTYVAGAGGTNVGGAGGTYVAGAGGTNVGGAGGTYVAGAGGTNVGGAGGAAGSSGAGGTSLEQARQLCITHINELRATKGKPPYQRWVAAEACVDKEATYDETHHSPHAAYFADLYKCQSLSENECLYGGTSSVVACLDAMWAEKDQPGCAGCDACNIWKIMQGQCPNCDFNGATVCGHYVDLSTSDFSWAACGFSSLGGWWAIDFK